MVEKIPAPTAVLCSLRLLSPPILCWHPLGETGPGCRILPTFLLYRLCFADALLNRAKNQIWVVFPPLPPFPPRLPPQG